MPSVPDGLKQQLHAAIADIAAVRGGYVGDLRSYSNKKGRKAERGTIKPKTFVAFTYRTSA